MIKKIIIGVVGVCVLIGIALAVYSSQQPSDVRITRSIVINAPAAIVFPFVNDFDMWPLWSPYEKLDPNMTKQLSSNRKGVGAVYMWEGNSDVGKGRMEIVGETVPSEIIIDLEFDKPMKSQNPTRFTFQENGGVTVVSWVMETKNSLPFMVMNLFTDMNKMIGADFEKGLSELKVISEQEVQIQGMRTQDELSGLGGGVESIIELPSIELPTESVAQ
jgi:hypothetical protein